MVLRMSESAKPYFAMICLQFGYAGMNLVTKVVLDRGMSHFVLVAYRNAFATAAIAPFALLSERKVRPKMTFPIFMQIFVLGLLGPMIDQNLYYAGLKLTSPTFSGAVTNIMPALTFIISIICRMEKVDMRKVRFQAKVVGTLVIVVGAMLMILIKSPFINLLRSHLIGDASLSVGEDYLKATVFLLMASFSWASFFVLQAATLKRYSSHGSLSTIVCFMGTLQSTALTFMMDPNLYAWNIGFDMNLLASVYAGIMSSSIALQENSGILTDIPTENEILGISRGISEEIPRKHKVSSEYTDGIPREYQSVGIFRGNSEEKCVPRKKPMNSEEIL
ncbi:hypothetical protein HID58_071299 [Brassica napus]|uniref:WAT1-related protein n=2 Tax=Brassica napus TaxID=3708 RepID=A0ABQ7Z1C4_BRANA|nr:hypothetical protein HID58_071299 [Brassica napus]CDY63536.1 BnaCnng42250D [Brassica napus]